MVAWERDWKSLVRFTDPHNVPAALIGLSTCWLTLLCICIHVYTERGYKIYTYVCIDMYTNICINVYVFSSQGVKTAVHFFFFWQFYTYFSYAKVSHTYSKVNGP